MTYAKQMSFVTAQEPTKPMSVRVIKDIARGLSDRLVTQVSNSHP